jgi:hypothetical protein
MATVQQGTEKHTTRPWHHVSLQVMSLGWLVHANSYAGHVAWMYEMWLENMSYFDGFRICELILYRT